jgi:hypothetical protein
MTLDANSNLTLGQTTSTARLTVQSGVANGTVAQFGGSSGGSDPRGLTIKTFSSNGGGDCGVDFNAAINNTSYGSFKFSAGSATLASIDYSGNLLVGKTSQSITTNGYEYVPAYWASGVGQLAVTGNSSSNSQNALAVYSTAGSAYRFYVSYGGNIYATNTTITGISDARLKENIRDLDDGLASVMALQPRKFDWKEGKGADIKNARGFIAQEFETVFPDLIDEWKDPAPEGEEPYKAVRADLIPVLVKAIQEQQAIIESLKARLDAANL